MPGPETAAAASATTSTGPLRRELLVALGLAAGAMVALGFTRFAYALLLPPMRSELDWSFTAAGGMNTSNAIGYVLGAASASWWGSLFGARRAFSVGIAASAITLIGSGLTSDYTTLSGLRFVGGVTTAVTFVLGSALAARAHTGGSQRRSAALVAVYMTGVGLGIVVSGVVVPAVLQRGGAAAWGTGWLIMGALAALLVAPAAWAVRQVPEQAATTSGTASTKLRRLAPLFVWYVLFGAGYVSYMTFVIALLREQQVSDGQVAVFFVVLGLASIIATLTVWGRVIARLPRGRAPSIISLIVAAGVLPVVLMDGFTAALVSAVVFGSSFMAGPTAATVLARRMLPARGWTTGIASLTVAFSIGQAVGPLLAGALSDLNGGIELGLWLSVVLLAVAGLVALTQRDIKVSLVTEAVAGTTR